MEKKSDITRKRIISEATRLINQKGFGATSVSDLISAAKVKKGCLYFHFPGKDDLGVSVLECARDGFMEFLDGSLSGETPGARLRNLFRNIMIKHKEAGFVGGCIFGNTALEMSDSDDRYASLVGQVFYAWAAKVGKVVKEAQAAGQVRADLPAGMLARTIVSTVEGGIMLARLKKNGRALKECLDALTLLLDLKA